MEFSRKDLAPNPDGTIAWPADRLITPAPNERCSLTGVDQGRMSASAIICTSDPDREGDIIDPQGCLKTLDSYRKNPGVFFGHREHLIYPIGTSEDPVTKQLALWIEPARIMATCFFSNTLKEAAQIFELVTEGLVRVASIGLRPIQTKQLRHREEGPAGPESPLVLISEWELLEWSFCSISVNANCTVSIGERLRDHLSRGILAGSKIDGELRKSLEVYAAPAKHVWSGGTGPRPIIINPQTIAGKALGTVNDAAGGTLPPNKKKEDDTVCPHCGKRHDDKPEEAIMNVKTKADEMDPAAPPEVPDEEPEQMETPEDDASEQKMPHGALMIKETLEHFAAFDSYLEEVMPLLDNEEIRALFDEEVTANKERMGRLLEAGQSKYPDVDFGVEAPAEETDDEDAMADEDMDDADETDADDEMSVDDEEEKEMDSEDMETKDDAGVPDPKKFAGDDDKDESEEDEIANRYRSIKRPGKVKGMTRKCKAVCADAADYMHEAANHRDMPKIFKAGHLHHGNSLVKMLKGMEDMATTKSIPTNGHADDNLDWSAIGQALTQTAKSLKAVKRDVKSLRGH